ncbi:MAG: 2-C-methyl-D-erythritol 4-phosphate cytidylyltransferase [Thermodesulfovibrionales bacterium]|jgi:2-C-methyl-D-erythritol 4-phosphate cytidylyltransferase
MEQKVTAIIPAAGLGKRLGPGTNKPFYHLLDKPLIVWTLEALERISEIGEIIPVIKESDMEASIKIFEHCCFSKVKRVAQGGKERQDSVYNGLKLLDKRTALVLIHDGVRPFVEATVIRKALGAIGTFDGVIAAVPLKDTIKEVAGDVVKQTLPRESLWAIQTPQVFRYDSLIRAYEGAMQEGFYSTDDSALVERMGGKVKIIMGSYTNVKITTPEDIPFAEFLLKKG